MKKIVLLMNLIVLGSLVSIGHLSATSLTGTYTLDGNAVLNGDGSYELTSTSTPSTSSGVYFVLNQTITFSQLADLNAVFTSNSGGVGGGSPRFYVDFSDGSWLEILYGPPGSFVGNDAVLNSQSGVNLIGLNDVGRYDLSGSGGSAYTTYAAALALDGSEVVTDFEFVTDTFGAFPDRDITLNSIGGTYTPSSVPDAASSVLLLGPWLGRPLDFWLPAKSSGNGEVNPIVVNSKAPALKAGAFLLAVAGSRCSANSSRFC